MPNDNELYTLTEAIAKALPGWSYIPPTEASWWARIKSDTDGREMHLSRGYPKKDRVNVSGLWPTYQKPVDYGSGYTTETVRPSLLWNPKEETYPEISVAMSRGAEVIAKEIIRRFLPEYTRLWHRCVELAKEYEQYEKDKAGTWEKVCAAAVKSSKHSRISVDRESGSDYITIEQSGRDTVKMSFYASADDAIAVMKLLKAKPFRGESA